jgi:hypothetical protein
VIVDNRDEVPPQFIRQPEAPPPVIDRKAIAAEFKAGREVPGCRSERAERLEIQA